MLYPTASLSADHVPADDYTPTDADWRDYSEWLDGQPEGFPQPAPGQDMTDAEWSALVDAYLADHDLSEVPF
jgi:hypothetical protein